MEQFVMSPYYGAADPYTVLQSAAKERFAQKPAAEGNRDLFRCIFKERRSYFWIPLPVSILSNSV